ncbi:hypothetical protein D4764_21G0004070 [Takifugu flavidus]|uniref:Uncharacterized protein n=1 Tax=Takifugu flavidus TaxID=433684 RepID=A0A5C6NIR2_9TELE|nr:hypothetical protein D4764_21G0004070 [Takifugu flavidus]
MQASQQQLRVWTRPGDYNSASFAGSLAIVKNGKPFTDGEYAKTFMLDVANELFDDLPNKDKIIKRIQDMPLSARTVHDRTIIMANQVEATQSFKARFGEFREHSSLFKFITHPNECSLNTADLSYIPDVTVRDFEAEVADLKASEMWKFSDDSAAVGLITDGDDTEYRELIQDFVDWSLRNNLQINTGKTKELVVDFRRRNNLPPAPGPLLRTFYDSVVGSAIFYGIVCWSSSITDRDRKRMDRLVRRASSVLGCPLDSVEVVGNGRMMAKLSSMLNNTSHPLQDTLTALGSSFSERLLHPRCVKERSFLPAAVRLHKKHNAR